MEDREMQAILARIESAEQWRDSNFGELWRECYRRYRSQNKQQREGSNIFVPHTFMQCEVIKARLSESLFVSRPYIAALPRGGEDMNLAAKMQTLLDWQMNERMDLPRMLGEEAIGSLIVYGTCVVYTGWKMETRRMKRLVNETQTLSGADGLPLFDEAGRELSLPAQRVVEYEALLYDDPITANIPLYDFFCDSQATGIFDARFCGHKEYMTRAALQALAEQGKYHIDWDKLKPLDKVADSFAAAAPGEEDFAPEAPLGLYLVHHYWEERRHLVIVNREQCVLDEPNPFWHGMMPYDKCCYVPLTGEFYGIGVPEILAGLQDELNTGRNQRIDYNSLSLRRMWKLRKGCGLTARDLVWRQNGVLQVENMDDVQEINIQGLPADAFVDENNVKQDMRDVTGCHDIMMGMAYRNETATTTVTRDNNASLRFKAAVRNVVKDLLVPIARKCAALNQQFLAEERALRLLGEPAGEMLAVAPEEINGDYDIIYCGTAIESAANKELNKERALQAYSLALADPAYQRDDLARLKLFRRVLECLEIKDGDNLLPRVRLAEDEDASSQAAALLAANGN